MNGSDPETVPGPLPTDLRQLLTDQYYPTAVAACAAMRSYKAAEARHREQANVATADILEHARQSEFLDPAPESEPGPDSGWRWTP